MLIKNNIFLIGPMGSGKSTIGYQLSLKLNMFFFDSDVEVEKKTGMSIDNLFHFKGESFFRDIEKKIIIELTEKTGIILATGGGSILSNSIRRQLSANGIIIYLNTDVKNQLIRVKYDNTRPLLQNKVISVKQCILESLYEKRDPLYKEISDIIINNNENNFNIIVDDIINILKKKYNLIRR